MDSTDKRIVSFLKQDARLPITSLAQHLNVSRATAQKRLDALIARGIIQGFTLRLNPTAEADLIRAVMLIELQGKMSPAVVHALKKITQIVSLDSTNGAWDMVAQIEAQNLPELDGVLRDVRAVPGGTSSETCILLDRA